MKTKLFTKPRFKKWLAGLKANRKFNYLDNRKCVFATFLRDVGVTSTPYVIPGAYFEEKGDVTIGSKRKDFPAWARDLDFEMIIRSRSDQCISARTIRKLAVDAGI